jgi:hypothetical protein
MSKKAVRKANRSGTLCCQICKAEVPLTEHHIFGRKIADFNGKWNRVWLCPVCHDYCHTTPPRIHIEGWFETTAGRELLWHRKGESKIVNDGIEAPRYGKSK